MKGMGQNGLSALVAVTILGVLLSQMVALRQGIPGKALRFPSSFAQSADKSEEAGIHDPMTPSLRHLQQRFQQGVAMLHAKRYEYAMVAFHEVIRRAPRLPEAYVNMGFALVGLNRLKAAEGYFNKATELNPYQGNAYWGLAEVYDKLGDVKGAMGAMRTYIHLAPPNDPYVRKARSALWEWDELLKKGPLSAEEQAAMEKKGGEWDRRTHSARDRMDESSLLTPSP
ncbi:MAG: hypothetical protein D6698_08435 [Gammaproteobacteria bacterium]|nr:MAG: hypothetical protein D6698_08435 [Gammaproteobacteria bacterium]